MRECLFLQTRGKLSRIAEVVKLVDTHVSGACAREGMWVRVPPSAPWLYDFRTQTKRVKDIKGKSKMTCLFSFPVGRHQLKSLPELLMFLKLHRFPIFPITYCIIYEKSCWIIWLGRPHGE